MDIEKWIENNKGGRYDERHYCNGLRWRIIEMVDGWFAIFKINQVTFEYSPAIQAADLNHALDYIEMREMPNAPINIF